MQRTFVIVAVTSLSISAGSLFAMARQCEIALQLYGYQERIEQRLKLDTTTPLAIPDFKATRTDGLQIIQTQLSQSGRDSAVWVFNPQTTLWREISQQSPEQDVATINLNLVRDASKSGNVPEYYAIRSPSILRLLYNDTIFAETSDLERGLLPLREDFQDLWLLSKLHRSGSAIVYGTVIGDSVTYLRGPRELHQGEADITEFTDFSSTRMFGIMPLDGIDPKLVLITHIRTLLHINTVIFDNDASLSAIFGARVATSNDFMTFDEWSSSVQTIAKPL